MTKLVLASMVLAFLSLTSGCQVAVDFEKERAEILERSQIHDRGLLEADVDALVSLFPEGHQIVCITDGEIFKVNREQYKQNFESQLNSGVRFTEINELEGPTIEFSPDGKLAWVYGKSSIKGYREDSTGSVQEKDFTTAWLCVLKKKGSGWIECAYAASSPEKEVPIEE